MACSGWRRISGTSTARLLRSARTDWSTPQQRSRGGQGHDHHRLGARSMIILGLDLSTRAAAAVACPLDWDGDWRRLRTLVVGEPLRRDATEAERIGRCASIAARLAAFARSEGATVAFVESYAYGQATAAHTLGELGGIVRLRLMEEGLEVSVANMS